ncbi:uncharacterized protein LOC132854501 isoform X1 [Tachysurus vachellii]|uniref:uncharacterized protein LOC132854501 isoform X1 n=1 Tax=Tachysurus vachellii TaxID=175792 RepID=UPI00296A9D00|nr:uncharacterized protein LOC132854501 isoform X1 [Tachysurus vachellii]
MMIGPILFNMKHCTLFLFLFYLMITACLSLMPGFTSTVIELHQPAALSCEYRCSGSVKWIKTQTLSEVIVVAQCNETSCSSEEGFNISHDQYLKGNLSLSITVADYSKRGWYTCWCGDRAVYYASLRIKAVGFLHQIPTGDSLVLNFQIPERLKVVLNRSAGEGGGGGARGAQSLVSVPVCSVDGRTVQCSDEYRKRVKLNCSLTLSDVQEADGGVYNIQDTENDEVISTHTLKLTGNDTEANDTVQTKGEAESWNLKRICNEEFRGLVVGGIIGAVSMALLLFGIGWIVKGYRHINQKMRRGSRGDHSTHNSDPEEGIKLPTMQERFQPS